MKALCWKGTQNVAIETVPDPKIEHRRDAIIKVTRTALCGSDLHLYNGVIPAMKPGDVLGHEFMGEVVETGSGVTNLKLGTRVVVPFTIGCGECFFCKKTLWSSCDNSNPNAAMLEKQYGQSGSGLYGYSHLYGGYSGGQAQYVRVPFADVGPFAVPDELQDDQVLFMTDILPTAYMAAENCNIEDGDTVAIWGAGPVGQLAVVCAYALGAKRVIAIDHVAARLKMAAIYGKAETLNFDDDDIEEKLKFMTGGRGPDSCIDCVGMEAHGMDPRALLDSAKVKIGLGLDRANVLRQMIRVCRKGGVVSIPGVYGSFIDQFPMGAAFGKGLTFKMGQTHVHRYFDTLTKLISSRKIDPTFIISHRLKLSEAPKAYQNFNEDKEHWTKVVFIPD